MTMREKKKKKKKSSLLLQKRKVRAKFSSVKINSRDSFVK
jgi:hypothetical protein